jgi:hypothetical protein
MAYRRAVEKWQEVAEAWQKVAEIRGNRLRDRDERR